MHYCKFCDYKNLNLSTYLKHLEEHSNLTKKLICGFERCNKVYSVLTSLQSHIHRIHKNNINTNVLSHSSTDNELALENIYCTVEHCTQKSTDLSK